jgi:hypothetical protein
MLFISSILVSHLRTGYYLSSDDIQAILNRIVSISLALSLSLSRFSCIFVLSHIRNWLDPISALLMFYFHSLRKQRRDELLFQQRRPSDKQAPANSYMHSERMERCKNCCKSLTTFIFSRVGLCLLVAAYAFGGGVVFQFLEAPYEGLFTESVQQRLNITVEKLFNSSEKSKVLYRSNWTAMAREILEDYQRELVQQTKRGYQGERFDDDIKQWTFAGAILYAITVITTIGKIHNEFIFIRTYISGSILGYGHITWYVSMSIDLDSLSCLCQELYVDRSVV